MSKIDKLGDDVLYHTNVISSDTDIQGLLEPYNHVPNNPRIK